MHLRCTLMGFERSYQIRILSKVLHKKEIRFYSTSSGIEPKTYLNEGCFRIKVNRAVDRTTLFSNQPSCERQGIIRKH